MSGTLYLCATPIGNLEDITFRVINRLKEVDLIAAEDTRHSIKLLNHFEIKTKMTSYHEYNRVEKAKVLVKQLQEGKDIAGSRRICSIRARSPSATCAVRSTSICRPSWARSRCAPTSWTLTMH